MSAEHNDRVLLTVLVLIVVGVFAWGIFGHTNARPCDANGLPDKHGNHICMVRP